MIGDGQRRVDGDFYVSRHSGSFIGENKLEQTALLSIRLTVHPKVRLHRLFSNLFLEARLRHRSIRGTSGERQGNKGRDGGGYRSKCGQVPGSGVARCPSS